MTIYAQKQVFFAYFVNRNKMQIELYIKRCYMMGHYFRKIVVEHRNSFGDTENQVVKFATLSNLQINSYKHDISNFIVLILILTTELWQSAIDLSLLYLASNFRKIKKLLAAKALRFIFSLYLMYQNLIYQEYLANMDQIEVMPIIFFLDIYCICRIKYGLVVSISYL